MPASAMTVRPLTLEDFRARRGEYETLLAASRANPLFHSFDWLELWWTHFGRPDAGETLRVLAAEQDGRLAGVLPLICNVPMRKGPWRYRTSAVLGNVRNCARGAPTEYTSVVAERGSEAAVLTACLRHWSEACRDREFTVSWCLDTALWVGCLEATRARRWETVRVTDSIVAYGVDLANGFEAYQASLSSNARRSMFNIRKKLTETAGLSFELLDPADAFASLERMSELHALRWKSPAFVAAALAFHRQLIERLGARGEVVFSEMRARGRPVSILYDIRRQGRQYNIQMGFDAEALPGASPGVIHLGFAIEEAAKTGVAYYDFLAGQGMQSDYKRRYANTQLNLGTLQYLRGLALNAGLWALQRLRRA